MSSLNPTSREVLDRSTSQAELRLLRSQIPKLTKHLFDGLFPADNIITAVQKNHGVHKIHMSEVATWVLNATHWFSLLDQPMMVIVWCHNWEDASKFSIPDADIAGSLW